MRPKRSRASRPRPQARSPKPCACAALAVCLLLLLLLLLLRARKKMIPFLHAISERPKNELYISALIFASDTGLQPTRGSPCLAADNVLQGIPLLGSRQCPSGDPLAWQQIMSFRGSPCGKGGEGGMGVGGGVEGVTQCGRLEGWKGLLNAAEARARARRVRVRKSVSP